MPFASLGTPWSSRDSVYQYRRVDLLSVSIAEIMDCDITAFSTSYHHLVLPFTVASSFATVRVVDLGANHGLLNAQLVLPSHFKDSRASALCQPS